MCVVCFGRCVCCVVVWCVLFDVDPMPFIVCCVLCVGVCVLFVCCWLLFDALRCVLCGLRRCVRCWALVFICV